MFEIRNIANVVPPVSADDGQVLYGISDGRSHAIVEIRDFVDHREYGVALELLWEVLKEEAIELSGQQYSEFRRLAKLMNIELTPS